MHRCGIVLSCVLAAPAFAGEKSDALVAPAVAKAKAAILRSLPVPEVAAFENLTARIVRHPNGKLVRVVCGLVNTFGNGGFAGPQSFVYVADPVQLVVVSVDTPPDEKKMVALFCG